MAYRKYIPINEHHINILKNNGCQAENWSTVMVTEEFDPARIRDVEFTGDVKIGSLSSEIEMPCGYKRKAGILRAVLNNVCVGDNCYISNIKISLSNLNIESNVVIENVGIIACVGETSFGNGHEISVLNEAGGRELKITKQTTAQIAYLTVLYRDNKKLITSLNKIADDYSADFKNNRAVIGRNTKIANCSEIINVHVGEYAIINGALSLKEGTIDSSKQAPAVVGNGVIAKHFIFQKGASVTEGATIVYCLIGESTQVGKQFYSDNSAFFANSECFLSEVCSVFAGPYSVTHHKSTLLIAGLCSFFNAGSGTNQSNHMYKLGPLHQGILERGCKTGSFSYLLWPCRVGSFSIILGKHNANFDTSDFPFAYITEKDGRSTIFPGRNLFTVGTVRDEQKWLSRDRRKNLKKLDQLIYNVLSPYTVQKIIRGQKILAQFSESSEKKLEYVAFKGIHLKRILLKTCIRYYNLAIEKYFGDIMVDRIEQESPENIKDMLKYNENGEDGDQEWVDIGGLICAKARVEKVAADIIAGNIKTFEQLQNAFQNIYNLYKIDEWNWFLANYNRLNKCEIFEDTDENLVKFLNNWKESSLKYYNMVLQDAKKEFDGNVKIGFGINGNVDADFNNVRGSFEDNSFVVMIKNRIEDIESKYKTTFKYLK